MSVSVSVVLWRTIVSLYGGVCVPVWASVSQGCCDFGCVKGVGVGLEGVRTQLVAVAVAVAVAVDCMAVGGCGGDCERWPGASGE